MRSTPASVRSAEDLYLLWAHECRRCLGDRLLSENKPHF